MACDMMRVLQDLYDWKDAGAAQKPNLTQALPRGQKTTARDGMKTNETCRFKNH